MHVLTREASQYIDEYVPSHFHIPLALLMENAGRGIADAIFQAEQQCIGEGRLDKRVLCICGVGNNGGDGLVAARHLKELGIPVSIAIVGDTERGSELFKQQLDIVRSLTIDIVDFYDFDDWSQVAVVVEGLMGTGFTGSIREPMADVLHRIDVEKTQYDFDLWAIDVPAGTDATTGQVSPHTLAYDYCVTFGAIKEGLLLYPGKEMAGTIIVAPLGVDWRIALDNAPFDTQHFTLDRELVETILHDRSPLAHKGVNGSTLIIGGSKHMIGAPIISAEASVHTGAGKVSLSVPVEVQTSVQAKVIPEVMVQSHTEEINYDMYDALAIGPGLGRTEDVNRLVNHIIGERKGPIIIDADGLYALGTIGSVSKDVDSIIHYEGTRRFNHCIMTPHIGEFGRLIGKSSSFIEKHYIALASAFSKAHDVVLVLKGIPTVVALPNGQIYINTLGNAGMGTGGMGDALTGIITAFVSQGYSLLDASLLGVYVHSRSADMLSEDKTWGYTPSDVSLHIGAVIKEILEG